MTNGRPMTEEEYVTWFNEKIRGYEMFTKTGDRKCQSIVNKLIKKIFSKKRVTMEDIQELAGKEIAKAYMNKKTSEIMDSEPPYHIYFYVDKAVQIAGYDWNWDSYNITDKVWDWEKKLKNKEEATV